MSRGRLWLICAGAICFADLYGDEIIFVTVDSWMYFGNVGVRVMSDFGILGRGRRG
jgi:tricorn protease-like protein